MINYKIHLKMYFMFNTFLICPLAALLSMSGISLELSDVKSKDLIQF